MGVWPRFNFLVDCIDDFKPVFDEAIVASSLFVVEVNLGGFGVLQNYIGFSVVFLPRFDSADFKLDLVLVFLRDNSVVVEEPRFLHFFGAHFVNHNLKLLINLLGLEKVHHDLWPQVFPQKEMSFDVKIWHQVFLKLRFFL